MRNASGTTQSTNDREVRDLIDRFGLLPHPEGGYYRETYRAASHVRTPRGTRSSATAILFLVTVERPSLFHRLLSDELWLHHSGAPLELLLLSGGAGARRIRLDGAQSGAGGEQAVPQACVPAGVWQAARVRPGGCSWALVSCLVTPGFEFADFQVAGRAELLESCPGEGELIAALTAL